MKRLIPGLLVVLLLVLPDVSQAALSDYFVSTDWLASNRGKVVVIDVRNYALYLLGHIDGAQSVERSQFLQTRKQVKSLVPTAAAITDLLSSLGVTPESTLVVYAEDKNPYAARLVWTLRYHGHDNSYVLDGGYQKWSAEEHATSMFPTAKPQPSHYVMSAGADCLQARASADYVNTRLENPSVLIWDTRSPGEYAGTVVRADRGGHIPGAVPFNWTNLQTEVNGVKVLKSRKELLAMLQAHGLTKDKEIIAHCQTGIRSSYATLVLLGLGYDRVRNYDGSWIEWANDPTLPIIDAKGKVESSVPVSLGLSAYDKMGVVAKLVVE
ncbi:MAG: sulfurtransferase [Geopsychrobacter sp.]|nr:sulfurtransferase [Geopsychrobacter sp.]